MSERVGFRISINLSSFYRDHRSTTRVFVNKNMKLISDLQNHIQTIFNINSCYLMSDRFYLPPTEDIRILQSDDIVSVWPLTVSDTNSISQENAYQNGYESVYQHDEVCTKTKKKRKKNVVSEQKPQNEQTGDELSNIFTNINGDSVTDTTYREKNVEKSFEKTELKKKKTVGEGEEINNKIQEECKKILSNSLEMENSSYLNADCSAAEGKDVSTVTGNCQKYVNDYWKDDSLQKAINESSRTNTTSQLDDSCPSFAKKTYRQYSSVGHLVSELQSGSVSDSGFVTKRKRYRVRKRKRDTMTPDNSITDSSECSFVMPKPPNLKPNIHIKFEERDTSASVIEILDEKKSEDDAFSLNDVLKERDLEKYPLMQTIKPRKGDIIAFKVLKITNSYCPDISQYIIARVSHYDNESEVVQLSILAGKEELQNPQGKFYVEQAVSEENVRDFFWKDLYGVKLLFP